jgi:hypothetical protein
VPSITAVQPVHVAGYIKEVTRARSAPTAKQRLSAIGHLFDWLVVGRVMPANPASSTPWKARWKGAGILEEIMGVWGAGLYSSDIAADLRATIKSVLRLPCDAAEHHGNAS